MLKNLDPSGQALQDDGGGLKCYTIYMSFEVINNPAFLRNSGFTQAEFKKLDALYLRAAAEKALTYRSVECDFDEGVASYTYYTSDNQPPYLQFIIRKVGPRTMMYELYLLKKGRIAKSGVFDRVLEKLQQEIEGLL